MNQVKGFRLASLIILLAASLPSRAIPTDSCMEEKCVTFFKKWKTKVRTQQGLAISALGELYYQGYGTEKNLSQSIKYFRKASRYQFAYAQYRAGVFYLMEEEFIDNVQGLKYLKRAAKNGHVESAFLLGVIFSTGELGILDVGESDKWLELALIANHGVAKRYVSYLLSSGQIDNEHYVRVNKLMTDQLFTSQQAESDKQAFINTSMHWPIAAGQGNKISAKDYLKEGFHFYNSEENIECDKIFSCYHINNESFWRYAQKTSK
jgi:TPR repeat protein